MFTGSPKAKRKTTGADYRKDEVKGEWTVSSSLLQLVHSCPSLPTPASEAVFAAVGSSSRKWPRSHFNECT